MQDFYSNRNVEKTALMHLSRLHMRSIPGPLALLPIIRFINYKYPLFVLLTISYPPPPRKLTIVITF